MKKTLSIIILSILLLIIGGVSIDSTVCASRSSYSYSEENAISVVRHIVYVYDENTQTCFAVSYRGNPTQVNMLTVIPEVTDEISKRMLRIQTGR